MKFTLVYDKCVLYFTLINQMLIQITQELLLTITNPIKLSDNRINREESYF
jgi:hypothetical protein